MQPYDKYLTDRHNNLSRVEQMPLDVQATMRRGYERRQEVETVKGGSALCVTGCGKRVKWEGLACDECQSQIAAEYNEEKREAYFPLCLKCGDVAGMDGLCGLCRDAQITEEDRRAEIARLDAGAAQITPTVAERQAAHKEGCLTRARRLVEGQKPKRDPVDWTLIAIALCIIAAVVVGVRW